MSLSGFVVKQIALSKFDDSNPREAILRHAKVIFLDFFKKEIVELALDRQEPSSLTLLNGQ